MYHHTQIVLLTLGLINFLLGLVSNHDPPDLGLLHTWDYSYVPPHLANITYLHLHVYSSVIMNMWNKFIIAILIFLLANYIISGKSSFILLWTRSILHTNSRFLISETYKAYYKSTLYTFTLNPTAREIFQKYKCGTVASIAPSSVRCPAKNLSTSLLSLQNTCL
jgi:hypothetical protein